MPIATVLPSLPPHKSEQTGNAVWDRIQNNIRQIVDVVRQLISVQPLSLISADAFKTTSAIPVETMLRFPVKAGEIWHVEFFGLGHCSSVNGMSYALGAPPNSVVSGIHYSSTASTAVANWFLSALPATPGTSFGAMHVGANDAGRPDNFYARVKCAGDGFISLKVHAITAGTTATLDGMALLRGHRLNLEVVP